MRKNFAVFQISVLFLFLMLFTRSALSQVESYTAKLTGRQLVFTPKKYEIFVKFTADATALEITELINQNEFILKYEKSNRRIKVLIFPENISFNDAKTTLLASSLVSSVMPVYEDDKGCDLFIDAEYVTVQFNKNLNP